MNFPNRIERILCALPDHPISVAGTPRLTLQFRIVNIFSLLYLLSGVGLAQTTIVAVRNSAEVVLAADSKGTTPDNKTRAGAVVCKIYSCANFFVGIAGVREAAINQFRFSFPPLLTEACRKGRTPQDKVAALERLLVPRLTRLLQEAKRRDITSYYQLTQTRAVLSVVMVGYEGKVPFIISRSFLAPASARAPVVVQVTGINQLGPLSRGPIEYSFGGHYEQINELVKTRTDLWGAGLVEASKFLVRYMIASRPDVVGPPIDILRIGPSGAKWIQRKPQCTAMAR